MKPKAQFITDLDAKLLNDDTMKKCKRCEIEQTTNNFGRDLSTHDGLSIYCRVCRSQKGKESYNRIKDRLNKCRREKRQENIEQYRKYAKEWRERNKDKIKETNRLRRLKEPLKVKEESARSQHKNRDHRNEYKRKWREENKDRIKETMPISQKVSMVVASNIRACLYGKKAGNHWEKIVNFTLYQLIEHLEGQFRDGMNWDNYGKRGWHIDHKRPISSFNFKTFDDAEFKQCWSLDNLQPLWATENLKKGNKYE
jgi:hypothetical protein